MYAISAAVTCSGCRRYTNDRCTYPGLREYHLMFPMFYERFTQRSHTRMYSSHDGMVWKEVPGSPVITPEMIGAGIEFMGGRGDLVPFQDGVGLKVGGTPYPHKYQRWSHVLESHKSAWACWPEGRLCSVTTDEDGEFFMFPVIPVGRQLRVNARVRRAGDLRVGLFGVEEKSANDCRAIFGDHPSHQVVWNGQKDIGIEEGREIMLHFKLRAADVFGIEWES